VVWGNNKQNRKPRDTVKGTGYGPSGTRYCSANLAENVYVKRRKFSIISMNNHDAKTAYAEEK